MDLYLKKLLTLFKKEHDIDDETYKIIQELILKEMDEGVNSKMIVELLKQL